MAHTLFHPDISNAAGVELRQELVVVDTDLSLIHKHTHTSEAHTQACTGTQMRLFLHPSHRIEKMTPNQYLEPLFFFQLIVTSVFTARNSFPPLSSSSWLSYCPSVSSPPSLPPCLSTIVAISRLLCMDFDCSQGAILHVAQSSHTNTHTQTCMHRRGGERKKTCL